MKKILFIGQAPARPASKHDIPGKYLHAWLEKIGINSEAIETSCYFYALTDTFPGSSRHGHNIPTPEQIAAHLPILRRDIAAIQPDIIVPVGKMAIVHILAPRSDKLIDCIGTKSFIDPLGVLGHPIPCIPLSHPSGRSSWNALHPELVAAGLALLQQEVASP